MNGAAAMTRKRTVKHIWCPIALLAATGAAATTGSLREVPKAQQGYTLLAPLLSTTTYLVDMDGQVVHTWPSRYPPGQAVYLLDNGNLLRCARDPDQPAFHGGGIGGRVEEIDWDGNVAWEFVYSDEHHCLHHDIEPLPSGNVLMIAWERKSADEALAAGVDPELLDGDEVWPDHVIEVEPQRPRGGRIVWEWHVWDHLVQDRDPARANYGVVAEHPELVDVNYGRSAAPEPPAEWRRLRGLGYVGGRPRGGPGGGLGRDADWNHTNSIAYHPGLDQIVLSVLSFNEIWIIDHSTTTEQAAGHAGGRTGRGGDLLYRWGNPAAYRAGTEAQRRLFAQHDARWIPRGCPGAGHILVFNNGRGRPDGNYSSVDEIVVPLTEDGRYARRQGEPYGPQEPAWRYTSPRKTDFNSGHISGAERLPDGNTLVCAGEQGLVFEVTCGGETVWEYRNPYGGEVRPEGGPPGGPRGQGPHGPPRGERRPGPGQERTAVFRAAHVAPDFPGLSGRVLKTLDPQPQPAE
jgi:hypothetical protein